MHNYWIKKLRSYSVGVLVLFFVIPQKVYSEDSLVIEDAWIRATPPGVSAGAGYMTIRNISSTDDKLIGASTDRAKMVQLHMTMMENDTAKMHHQDTIEIKIGSEVKFEPGGLHIMFMGLTKGFEEGQHVSVTLTFQHAGEMRIEMPVLRD